MTSLELILMDPRLYNLTVGEDGYSGMLPTANGFQTIFYLTTKIFFFGLSPYFISKIACTSMPFGFQK